MRVLVIWEWDMAKDAERLKKAYGSVDSEYWGYMAEVEKGRCKTSAWTDGTGHIVQIQEFESMEDFAKVWGDDEYHRCFVRLCRSFDNASRRTVREAISTPL